MTNEQTQTPPSQIRYCYLSDPKDPRRIMTIGRRLQGNTVTWTMCINNPVDRFQKKLAHQIIEGRFEKERVSGAVDYGNVRPIEFVVKAIADKKGHEDAIASRIAKAHLHEFEKVSVQKEVKAEASQKPKRPSARATHKTK